MNTIITKVLNLIEKKKIDRLCDMHNITDYTINDDGSIDVVGDVDLCNNMLNYLPITFHRVTGDFMCGFNRLTSLEGCPKEVGGDFSCSYNKLTSLEHCPTDIGGDISFHSNDLPINIIRLRGYGFLPKADMIIFVKYQKYYDVWLPEFNIDGFNELIAEIRDGLK
jgi:hypothetical protein